MGDIEDDLEPPTDVPQQEKEALFYAKLAISTLRDNSTIVLQASQRKEIAFQYAFQAFKLAPQHNELLAILFQTAELCGRSLFDVLTKEEIEQALETPKNRETTLRIILETLKATQKAMDQGNRNVIPLTPAKIMLIEIIEKKEPTPTTKAALASEYIPIGRYSEAIQLFEEAAEEDTRYAPLYIKHCSTSTKRYKELIEYWEKFNPTVSTEIEMMVVEAYLRESTSPNSEESLMEIFSGIPVKRYESLKKAKAIAERHYHLSSSMGIGEFSIASATSYASILYKEADIVERLEPSADRTNLPNVEELLQASRTIFREVISTLQSSGLCDRNPKYQKILILAKTGYLSASRHTQQELPELEADIATAEEMLQSGETDITGERSVVINTLGILTTKKFIITKDTTLLQRAEAIFLAGLKSGWRDINSYSILMQLYSLEGNFEMVHTIETYRELAAILDNLVQVDTLGRNQGAIHIGIPERHIPPRTNTKENFLDDLIAMKMEGLKALEPLEEYFSPLYEAIRPHSEQYMAYLRGLAGDSAEISHRIKKPESIILKMLKKEPAFSVNSDMTGFRVITETEEEARTLYEKVKEDMEPGKDLKEWKTLDNPTQAGYRSLDITGRSKSCEFLVQVQIRPREIDERIKSSKAHHDYYKVKSGTDLEEKVNQNPFKYFKRLRAILYAISEIYRKIKRESLSLNLDEIINLYEETIDRLMREEEIPATPTSSESPASEP